MSLPDLFLTHPTPEEVHAQLLGNSSEWRGALSQEAYLRREAHMADQDLTRSGGLTQWILAKRQVDGSRQAVSSCETLRKRALLAVANEGVSEVTCYGVASVFTLPEFRGKGYASTMFGELEKWMDDEGRGKAGFSVLYSDIGKRFYAKHGWRPMESSHVSFRPGDVGIERSGDVRLLKAGEVASLCERDESMVRDRLERLAKQGKNAVAICPDEKTIRWQLSRESFVSQEILAKVPDVVGAMTTTASGKGVWCLWTRWLYNRDAKSAKGNNMHILRLAVDDEEYDDSAATERGVQEAKDSEAADAIARLLSVAQDEATEWFMEDIHIWNPSSATMAAVKKLVPDAQVEHREKDSIASLRWCDSGFESLGKSLRWTSNEKYAWC
ncbi:Cell division control protein 45 [Elsinoe australis]|uniref:Cell division control protein 45 n=1 Tax=Elsinoe australis TaxID=40998 RepID=A0A2P8AFC9_9PEZI|nr:Cell division control protein 45 [Elsinoe australis]